MSQLVKSKGAWGKRDPRTASELDAIYKAFFAALRVPKEWKFTEWSNVFDKELITEANPNGTLLSIGKTFMDSRTSGLSLMHYRVFFLTYSERGGVCSKSIIDFGKFKRNCVINNKTVEKLNEWIDEQYTILKPIDTEGNKNTVENDKDDGLQGFRDRFGDRVVDGAR